MTHLDAPSDLERGSTVRALVAGEYFGCLDHPVGGEVAAVGEIDHVFAGLVGAGDPTRALDDARIDEQSDAGAAVRAERAGSDVALDECRIGGEVAFVEGLEHGGFNVRAEPLLVDVAISGHSHRQRLGAAVRVAKLDDHVLHRVGGGPLALRAGELGVSVEVIDEGLDRGGVGGVRDPRRWEAVEWDRIRNGYVHGLGIGGVVARAAPHERVLADVDRREELLGGRSAHRPGHRRDDHGRKSESFEGLDVGIAMEVVRPIEALVVDVEAVRVLHHELAAPQQARSWTRFVAVLGLDLVDVQRQVLVRAVQSLHEQGEHLLVGRRQQEVVAVAVAQAKQVVAVLDPPIRGLIGLFGQQRREMNLLETGGIHLLANDALDIAVDDPSER